ncbi:hypothetical protein [Methanogenium organophilum]|uniref:Uncharacterized protein n=1 Tax=Methanogenium organophilum TaxID=2199 RepID=A0A9X9S6E6_METOG|nr:hypothetical protein [Methanogenium organophilum]WAI02346.1 hypothetical protein OU421_05600 [Methanogenium organophilum]
MDGKKVGVSGLTGYWRLWQRWSGPVQVKEALLLAVKAANYVPTKKSDAYADALYSEYLQFTKQR